MWKTIIVLLAISLVPLGCSAKENLNVALIDAVKSHDGARVQELIRKGADVNCNLDGSPLAYSLELEDFAVAGILVEHGANVDEKDRKGKTLLIRTCMYAKKQIARFLIEHGAQVNAQDINGYTPLFYASYATSSDLGSEKLDPRYTDLVKFLIESGAEVDLASKDGYTPLDIATSTLRYPIMKILLVNGADINRRAKDGRTPLYYAIVEQDPKLLQFLLDKGADPNIVMHNITHKGLSYLQIAERLGNKKIIEALKAAGAVEFISEPGN
jgi:ankyrin repeat protein